eukprot:3703217-Amphidinium_carterae.2
MQVTHSGHSNPSSRFQSNLGGRSGLSCYTASGRPHSSDSTRPGRQAAGTPRISPHPMLSMRFLKPTILLRETLYWRGPLFTPFVAQGMLEWCLVPLIGPTKGTDVNSQQVPDVEIVAFKFSGDQPSLSPSPPLDR